MKLYSFFNSSASYRVRIALALKGIHYQTVGVNIRIGQQNELAYRRMNPVGLVPTLLTDDGEFLSQSNGRSGAQPDTGNRLCHRLRYSPGK